MTFQYLRFPTSTCVLFSSTNLFLTCSIRRYRRCCNISPVLFFYCALQMQKCVFENKECVGIISVFFPSASPLSRTSKKTWRGKSSSISDRKHELTAGQRLASLWIAGCKLRHLILPWRNKLSQFSPIKSDIVYSP